MRLATLAIIAIIMVGCGPSESAVQEQLNAHSNWVQDELKAHSNLVQNELKAHSNWVTDTVQESLDRQQELLNNQQLRLTAQVQEMLDADVERDKELLDRYYESVDTDLYEAGHMFGTQINELEERIDADIAEFGKRVDENLVGSRQLYEDVLLEVKVYLEQALCDVDHKLNTNRSVSWWTLDYLAGGETTIEDSQELWHGIPIEDDYGATVSGICTISDEGYWEIIDGPERITSAVLSR